MIGLGVPLWLGKSSSLEILLITRWRCFPTTCRVWSSSWVSYVRAFLCCPWASRTTIGHKTPSFLEVKPYGYGVKSHESKEINHYMGKLEYLMNHSPSFTSISPEKGSYFECRSLHWQQGTGFAAGVFQHGTSRHPPNSRSVELASPLSEGHQKNWSISNLYMVDIWIIYG